VGHHVEKWCNDYEFIDGWEKRAGGGEERGKKAQIEVHAHQLMESHAFGTSTRQPSKERS